MKDGWWRLMKDDEGWWRMVKDDEGWWRMVKDDEGSLISSCFGVLVYDRWTDGQMNKRTDICECRVAFATENSEEKIYFMLIFTLYGRVHLKKIQTWIFTFGGSSFFLDEPFPKGDKNFRQTFYTILTNLTKAQPYSLSCRKPARLGRESEYEDIFNIDNWYPR